MADRDQDSATKDRNAAQNTDRKLYQTDEVAGALKLMAKDLDKLKNAVDFTDPHDAAIFEMAMCTARMHLLNAARYADRDSRAREMSVDLKESQENGDKSKKELGEDTGAELK